MPKSSDPLTPSLPSHFAVVNTDEMRITTGTTWIPPKLLLRHYFQLPQHGKTGIFSVPWAFKNKWKTMTGNLGSVWMDSLRINRSTLNDSFNIRPSNIFHKFVNINISVTFRQKPVLATKFHFKPLCSRRRGLKPLRRRNPSTPRYSELSTGFIKRLLPGDREH